MHQSLPFLHCCEKLGAFLVYYLSFNLADLNWPKEQSTGAIQCVANSFLRNLPWIETLSVRRIAVHQDQMFFQVFAGVMSTIDLDPKAFIMQERHV